MDGLVQRLPFPCLRWLLPVMLVLGVWGMHTLGHLSSHHGETAAFGSYALMFMDQSAHGGAEPAGAASAANAPSMPWLDPSAVCLAVLTSILALLIAATWAAGRRWPGGSPGRAPWVGGVARPPPRRLAPTLAGLSVMRT
ncbi:DUF6153 family protein [Nonomuraea sp. NPDC049400]|uniref:DUF6153 family protein n=1 Tax=Nonomuraea sp. NPDC049400 TaxID=3364352 RepID=UPI0037A6B09E